MLKNFKNPQNFNVFTISAGFPGIARVAGVAVKYASGYQSKLIPVEIANAFFEIKKTQNIDTSIPDDPRRCFK